MVGARRLTEIPALRCRTSFVAAIVALLVATVGALAATTTVAGSLSDGAMRLPFVAADVQVSGTGAACRGGLTGAHYESDDSTNLADARLDAGVLAPQTAAVHASELVESPLWTATKSRTSAQNANRHWADHGADFPDIQNSLEYVAKSQNFLRTLAEGTLTRVRTNGDVVRWHPSSNTFGVTDAGGAPRTFFRPDSFVDIPIGDMVMAADPETGDRGARRVTDTIIGDGIKELVDIEIDGRVITATDRHPFWVDYEGRWVDAEDLEPGDVLLLASGRTVAVDAVRERTEVRRVHNLTVEGIHTYYVLAGEDPVLVHNCSVDDPSQAAAAADRNGLTAAGRAALKHGDRPGSTFPLAPDRTASGYNQFGQDLVDDLLTAPNTATRSYVHPSYGQVTEYLGPRYGARWGPNGEFLGFL